MSRQPQRLSRRALQTAFIIVLLPLIIPLAILSLILLTLHRIVLYALVWLLWLPRGKDVLFVFSDSPVWRDYMAQQVLPLVQGRAVVVNWTERSKWPKWWLAAHVLRTFGGGREFNPLVIVFPPLRRAQLFRFWQPFKDWKRGYSEPVERLTNDLRLSL
jgi:hypothetical protein